MLEKSTFESSKKLKDRDRGSIWIVNRTSSQIKSLEKILQTQGLKIADVKSDENRSSELQESFPDLILLDLGRSFAEGIETCQRLKSHPHLDRVPLLVLLPLKTTIDKGQLFRAGAADYLTYPFQEDEVLARLKHHLALQKAETKNRELNAVLENAMEGISHLDSQGYYLNVNKAYADLVGREPQEMVGLSWSITVYPEDIGKALDAYQAMLVDGKAEAEIRGIHRDGSIFYKQVVLIEISDRQGQFAGHYCFAKDITKRKQRETVLQNITLGLSAATGETIFHSLVQHLSQALDMEFAFIGELVGTARGRVRTIAVYKEGKAIENFEYDLVHTPCERIIAGKLCIYPQNVRQKFPLDPHLREMGVESYVGIPLFDSEERPFGLIAAVSRKRLQNTELFEEVFKTFAVRVTSEIERKHLELSLQASQAKLSGILDSALAAITSVRIFADRTDWERNYCSAGCEEVYGYTAEEIMADKNLWRSRVLPEDLTTVILPSLERYWAQETVSFEYRFYHKDGSLRWLSSTSTSRWDEDMKCWVITAVDTDISDLKAAEAGLRQYERMVSATPDMMALVDRNYTYRLVNQACLDSNRAGWQSPIGHRMSETFGEETFKRILKPNFDRCLAGETVRFEAWLDYPNERRFVGMTYAPYVEANGTITGVAIDCRNLTELKQAEDSLRQSEALFRSLFEQAAVGIAFSDSQCKLIRPNQKFCEILGYSETELQSLTFRDITHPEDLPTSSIYNQQLKRGERDSINLEKRYVRKDGAVIWANTLVSHIRETSGALQLHAILIQDITERKQAQEELQRQNQRSQLVAEIALKIRRSWQVKEILQTTVREVQKLLDADRVLILRLESSGEVRAIEEAVRSQWLSIIDRGITDDCLSPDYQQEYRQGRIYSISDVDNSRHVPDCMVEFLQEYHVKAKLAIPVLLQEKLWGLIVVHQCSRTREWSAFEIDLLEQVANQVGIALTQSQREDRFRSLIENASDIITLLDGTGQICYVSPSVKRLLGYSRDRLVGQPLSQYLHPDDRSKAFKIFTKVLKAAKKIIPIEIRWQERQGNWRVFEAIAKQFKDSTGFTGAIVSFRDITERLKIEEMRRALEREKELSELKLRFFSMASHELRTPLSVILLSTQVLEHSDPRWLDAKKLRNIHRIQDTVKNLTQMLENVLTIARAEAQKLEFNPKPFYLFQYCSHLVREIQDTLGANCPIEFTYTGKEREVGLDRKLLHSIITNLLSNAIKYSHSDRPVSFHLVLHDDVAVLAVEDRGVGIPLEDRTNLFEAFYRGQNVGKIEGSGLGLAVVKRCVDLHGGKVSFDSTVGQGTTFTVWLPLISEPIALD